MEAKQALESLIGYQNEKMSKFENKFAEILDIFKKQFSEQKKELIISYGEQFVRVNNNPFAKDALKESIDFGQIERTNQLFELFI